jgi:hypothetical protein
MQKSYDTQHTLKESVTPKNIVADDMVESCSQNLVVDSQMTPRSQGRVNTDKSDERDSATVDLGVQGLNPGGRKGAVPLSLNLYS